MLMSQSAYLCCMPPTGFRTAAGGKGQRTGGQIERNGSETERECTIPYRVNNLLGTACVSRTHARRMCLSISVVHRSLCHARKQIACGKLALPSPHGEYIENANRKDNSMYTACVIYERLSSYMHHHICR